MTNLRRPTTLQRILAVRTSERHTMTQRTFLHHLPRTHLQSPTHSPNPETRAKASRVLVMRVAMTATRDGDGGGVQARSVKRE